MKKGKPKKKKSSVKVEKSDTKVEITADEMLGLESDDEFNVRKLAKKRKRHDSDDDSFRLSDDELQAPKPKKRKQQIAKRKPRNSYQKA